MALTIESPKIRIVVLLTAIVTPQQGGHVGKSRGGDQFARNTLLNGYTLDSVAAFKRRVVDFHGNAQTTSGTPANIQGDKRVAGSEASCDISAARNIIQASMGWEPFVVEPLKQCIPQDHSSACDNP